VPADIDLRSLARDVHRQTAATKGERRYYQVYFRDANPNYCPAPGPVAVMMSGMRWATKVDPIVALRSE
jgi:hypothetical protein